MLFDNFKVAAFPVNLDQMRYLVEPVTITEEKFLCCLCCQSGPIKLIGSIPKQAFTPGEQIQLSFELDNMETDQPLRAIEAKLMAKFKATSNIGVKYENEWAESSVELCNGMAPRNKNTWNVTLNIPKDTTPNFQNCKCLQLDYYFIVKVDIEAHFDANVSFPITISSGPFSVQPSPMSIDVSSTAYAPQSILPSAKGYPPPSLSAVIQQPASLTSDVPLSYQTEEK